MKLKKLISIYKMMISIFLLKKNYRIYYLSMSCIIVIHVLNISNVDYNEKDTYPLTNSFKKI